MKDKCEMNGVRKHKPLLDKWDSQIMLLSKGHFDEEMKELNLNKSMVLKALWADRCGVDKKYVELRYVMQHIIAILDRVGLLGKREVIALLADTLENSKTYSDVASIIYSALSVLSTLQVKESIMVDGEYIYEDLVIYEEKYTSFLDGSREDRDDVEIYKISSK